MARSLRGFLGVFLREMNSGIKCSTYVPVDDPEELAYARQGIKKLATNITNCTINDSTVDTLHELSKNEISALENLLPVAAEISAAHLICWHNVLEHVKDLGDCQSRDSVKHIIVQLLDDINEFDNQQI